MASKSKEETTTDGTAFVQSINKKIKKIQKKLKKIAEHKASIVAKKPALPGANELIALEPSLLEKVKIYESALKLYNATASKEPLQNTKKEEIKQDTKPIEVTTQANEEIDIMPIFANLVIVHDVAHLFEEKSAPISFSNILGKPYLEALMKVWNSSLQMPMKFSLGTWKKQVIETLNQLGLKSSMKIQDTEVTYKELAMKLEEAFKDATFINADVNCEPKVEKPVEKEAKKEEAKDVKEIKEEKKEVKVESKVITPVVVAPVVKVEEKKVEEVWQAPDWAADSLKENEKEAIKVPEQKKKSEEEDEWIVEGRGARRRGRGHRRPRRNRRY